MGHGPGCHGETVVLRDRTAREAIVAAGNALEDTLRHEPGEVLAVDARPGGLPGGDYAPALGKGEEAGIVGRRHV